MLNKALSIAANMVQQHREYDEVVKVQLNLLQPLMEKASTQNQIRYEQLQDPKILAQAKFHTLEHDLEELLEQLQFEQAINGQSQSSKDNSGQLNSNTPSIQELKIQVKTLSEQINQLRDENEDLKEKLEAKPLQSNMKSPLVVPRFGKVTVEDLNETAISQTNQIVELTQVVQEQQKEYKQLKDKFLQEQQSKTQCQTLLQQLKESNDQLKERMTYYESFIEELNGQQNKQTGPATGTQDLRTQLLEKQIKLLKLENFNLKSSKSAPLDPQSENLKQLEGENSKLRKELETQKTAIAQAEVYRSKEMEVKEKILYLINENQKLKDSQQPSVYQQSTKQEKEISELRAANTSLKTKQMELTTQLTEHQILVQQMKAEVLALKLKGK